MKPIEITLDVSKINKAKITERVYENKNGEVVTVKEYKIKVVPLKDKKFVTKGKDWEMFKTHFVVEKKDSRDEEDNFIGNGFEFVRQEEPRDVSKLEPEDTLRDNEMPNFDNNEEIPF